MAAAMVEMQGAVFAPITCDLCTLTRARISEAEVLRLLEHGEVPCPCGSVQTYVGAAGLAEAVSIR